MGMIRSGFLSAEDRRHLIALARDGSAASRLTRRANALVLLDIWFGGEDRSEASMSQFCAWLGKKNSSRIRLAVMDMWKPFRLATNAHAPQTAILFDKFHVIRHLGEALDAVRKREYARVQGRERPAQRHTRRSRRATPRFGLARWRVEHARHSDHPSACRAWYSARAGEPPQH
jgi:hypothetical protein